MSHLCASVAHESAPSHAADEVGEAWARRGPEAEGAVDVDPGAAVVRDGDRRLEVVEGARVDLAGLDADDRRGIVRREDVAEQLDPHPALVVDRDDFSCAPPMPSSRSARVSVMWRFAPTTTRSGGAPARPRSGRS